MSVPTRRSVLLIEGDEGSRVELERALAGLKAAVLSYSTAQSALTGLGANALGLIVLGVDPTDFADLAAMMRIRELPVGRNVPLIALVPVARAEQARVRGMIEVFNPVEFLPRDAKLIPALAVVAERHAELEPPEVVAPKPVPRPTAVTMEELRETYAGLGRLNLYERLGVTATDGSAEVRRAFMKRVQRYRPENVAIESHEARRMLRGIHEAFGEAYATLRDPGRRTRYEARLAKQFAVEYESSRASISPPPEVSSPVNGIDDLVAPESSEPFVAPIRAEPDPVAPPAVAPSPVAPSPVAPAPVAPAPVAPAPVTPSPVAPSPVAPAPVAPAPVTPSPVAPVAPAPPLQSNQPPPENSGVRWSPPAEISNMALRPPRPASDGAEEQSERPAKKIGGSARKKPMADSDSSRASLKPPTVNETTDHWSRARFDQVSTIDKLSDAARLRSVMGDYAGAVELLEQALLLQPEKVEFQTKMELYKGWRAKQEEKLPLAKRHFKLAMDAAGGYEPTAAAELAALGVKISPPGTEQKKRTLASLFGFGKDK